MLKSMVVICLCFLATACASLGECKPTIAPRIDPDFLESAPLPRAESAEYVDILDWGLQLSKTIEMFNERMGLARVANGETE